MIHRTHWPVLIVGAGPAGLCAAITLARAGIECLVVDRRFELSRQPRATAVNLRAMELFRSWGIDDAVRSRSDVVTMRMLIASTLTDAASGTAFDVGMPTDEQSALISPTAPACLPQDELERVLRAHLGSLPAAHLLSGHAVEDLDQDSAGCRVHVRDLAAGGVSVVHADFVVAADGVHSTVRELVGINRWRSGRLREAIGVVFRAPLWELVGAHRYLIYAVERPGGAGAFLPAGHGDRWLHSFDWDPAAEQLSGYPEDRLRARIRAGAGHPTLPVQIESLGAFAFEGSVADRFRQGRVFLAGDAAHQVTPRGGTGMNTAIADGFDLGWKLSWVLNQWSSAELLDTYEIERRPVAEHNLARSIDPEGSRRPAVSELGVDLGGRLPHVWVDANTTSTLDLLGPGLTHLICGPAAPSPEPSHLTGPPVQTHRLAPIAARALGLRSGTRLLLRPDGLRYDAPAAVGATEPSLVG